MVNEYKKMGRPEIKYKINTDFDSAMGVIMDNKNLKNPGKKPLKAIAGSKDTMLELGDIKLECYVLEDGTRVFSGNGLQKALKFPKNAGGMALTKLLSHNNISDFVSEDINTKLETRKEFIRPGAGGALSKTYGYDATLLIDICDLFLELRKKNILSQSQIAYADRAEIILRTVSKVGIISLIDEVTGYQFTRGHDALRILLNKYIEDEFRKWVKRFPDNFFEELDRLYNNEKTKSRNRPLYYGKFINKYIYDPLENGYIKKGLDDVNIDDNKKRKARFHQWLTDFGISQLSMQLGIVISTMRLSKNMTQFEINIKKQQAPNIMSLIEETVDDFIIEQEEKKFQ